MCWPADGCSVGGFLVHGWCQAGEREGFGVADFATGKYSGEFKAGKFNGVGIIDFANGERCLHVDACGACQRRPKRVSVCWELEAGGEWVRLCVCACVDVGGWVGVACACVHVSLLA